jgi:o-succinylbenzoate synthase
VRIESVELRVVDLPLVAPFVAAHGTVRERPVLLVRVVGPDGDGWGECAALPEPTYTAEFVDGALLVLRDHLVPRLLATSVRSDGVDAGGCASVLSDVVGHPMAVAALELAVLDAEGRSDGTSLAQGLAGGATPADSVPGGVAIGLSPSPDELAEKVAVAVAEGYTRVKVKVAPGRDAAFVRAARQAAGPGTVLVVDANASYRLDGRPGEPDDARGLGWLDELDIGFLEQPLAADELGGHATLARRLSTPICLDESLTSVARTRQALDAGACSVVCVKAPRYGSWLGAAEVLDHCARHGVDAWVGGMLDGAVGRAANVALAAHPGATLPGDISATGRTFTDDVGPFLEPDAASGPTRFAVPSSPGVGVRPDGEALRRLTRHVETLPPARSVVGS